MNIQNINCKSCGAPIALNDNERFLNCSYCGTNHKITYSFNSISAEIIEQIGEVSQNLDIVKIQNMIEFLDRQWDEDKEKLLQKDTGGRYIIPTKFSLIKDLILIVAFLFFLNILALGFHPIVFVIMVLISLYAVYHFIEDTLKKIKNFKLKEETYILTRKRLMNQLNEIKEPL